MALTELYRFEAFGQQWTYTSGDAEAEHEGLTYERETIARTEPELTQDIRRSDIRVTVPRDNDVGAIHLQYAPESVTTLTIFQREESGETEIFWQGRVTDARADGSKITLICENVYTALRLPGLRQRYTKGCRHGLYALGCNLNAEDFAVLTVLAGVSGRTLTVPVAAEQPDGWYLGGMLRVGNALRMITAHVGAQVTITRPILGLEDYFANSGYGLGYGLHYGGFSVKLYPGCGRTREICHSKFNNVPNMGAFPWFAGRDLYGGTSLL